VAILIALGGLIYSPAGLSFGDVTDAVSEDEKSYNHTLQEEFMMNNMSYSALGVETTQTAGSGVVSEDVDGVFLLIETRVKNRDREVRTAPHHL